MWVVHHDGYLVFAVGRRSPIDFLNKASNPPPLITRRAPHSTHQVKQDGIARLNALSPQELRTELLRICGSTKWADRVARTFPHATPTALLQAMDQVR